MRVFSIIFPIQSIYRSLNAKKTIYAFAAERLRVDITCTYSLQGRVSRRIGSETALFRFPICISLSRLLRKHIREVREGAFLIAAYIGRVIQSERQQTKNEVRIGHVCAIDVRDTTIYTLLARIPILEIERELTCCGSDKKKTV